jgi:hypothetical protein
MGLFFILRLMKEFRVGPEGIKTFRRLILKRMLIIVPFFLVIIAINAFSFFRNDIPFRPTYLLFIIGPFLFFGFILFNIIRKNERMFKSYVLTIENILIRREQYNTPEVDIYFNEIVQIRKTRSKWLIVKGKYAGDVIYIPPFLDNFKDLENSLREIMPFTTKATGTFFERFRAILALVSLAAMITALLVDNKIIDSTCLCIYVFITVRNFIDARRNKNLDNKTRQRLWIQLVIAGIVAVFVILKITDNLETSFSYLFPSSQ